MLNTKSTFNNEITTKKTDEMKLKISTELSQALLARL